MTSPAQDPGFGMTRLDPIPSVEETVANALRNDIVRLRLRPGARLRMAEVAARAGVSLTPAKQALLRLEGEGLVVSAPRTGSRVAPLSWDDGEVVVTVCTALEHRLVDCGVPRLTDDDQRQIGELLERRGAGLAASDTDAVVDASTAIRDLICTRAGRPHLYAQAQPWRLRQQRYLQHIRDTVPVSHDFFGAEFTAFVEHCLARDARGAESALDDIAARLLEWLKETLPPTG